MPRRPPSVSPPGCYVISLRPAGGHGGVRAAAARRGWPVIALSPLRIAPRDDPDTRRALRAALACDVVVFTSPNAVRAAAALARFRPMRSQAWCAVGSATAAALRRAGVAQVASPKRMDSEGLLALPALARGDGRSAGLVTAPGGRGLLAPALAGRGFVVTRADVYTRTPAPLRADALARLRAATATPWCVPLTSGEAFSAAVTALPPELRARLLASRVIVASARLAALARAAGCGDVRFAGAPTPTALVAAA